MSGVPIQLENFSDLEQGGREDDRPVLDRLNDFTPGSKETDTLTLPVLREGEHYRFHFDMARCIGCRSCEVACNEQNDNPSHVRWRRVGEIEGGSYPHVQRFNLSMSCNHCLEPSCMEGCPTDAYTKLENGIVAHDEEACIGCQYCTWSCPYGVPQYHPERRVVTKCHLCAERLAEGDLPACVQACPTRAIEVEAVNVAEWRRSMTGADAPGVPAADLTLSTTRITLPEGLPADMGKLDFRQIRPEAPHWPLVFLLVLSQWSVGLFSLSLLLGFGSGAPVEAAAAAAIGAAAIGLAALGASAFHLGKPLGALKALRAWRRSWLSREALCFLVFGGLCFAVVVAVLIPGLAGTATTVLAGLAFLSGAAGVVSSAGIYLLPARPAWNTWRTPAQFALTALHLAAHTGLFILLAPSGGPANATGAGWALPLAVAAAIGAVLQALIPFSLAARGFTSDEPPLRGAAILLTRRLGRLLWGRTAALGASGLASILAAFDGNAGRAASLALLGLVLGVAAEIAGRYLFFVAVVPRNMPGHFFSQAGGGH